jgi:DNA replication protein DnaC
MRKLAESLKAAREAPPCGPPPSSTEEGACQLCGGSGFVRAPVTLGHPDFGKALPCACILDESEEQRLRRQQVPPHFHACTFANFDPSLNPGMECAVRAAKAVAAGKLWGALLIGECGTGKTHLAVAAMKETVHPGAMFRAVPHLLDYWRRAYDVDRRTPEDERVVGAIEELMAPFMTGRFLLVLDDLGTEKATEWVGERLWLMLDARYGASLPTIVTSNVDPGRLDPRIVSRFGRGVVACVGKDVRLRKGATNAGQGKGPGELRREGPGGRRPGAAAGEA